MRAPYDTDARKRAVNLTLNEDLVARARRVTDNLSGVVESLLASYLARNDAQRAAEVRAARDAVAAWNAFAEEHGSFADEHSTL